MAEPLELRRLMAADLWGGLFGATHSGVQAAPHADGHGSLEGVLHASSLQVRTATHLIDGQPHLFTWEPAPGDLGSDPVLAAATLGESVHPLTSLPALNSDTGAAASLYLDFDGHFQSSWGAWSNITTPVYDDDGDESTFSDAELATIYAVWQRVAEDFLPFKINVTTVEPPTLAAGAPESGANGNALRIAIGGTSEWMGASWGGYAYINAFTSSIANVAYVFAGGSNSINWMSNVVSHEAGHAFGLHHQSEYDANGVRTSEYHPGTETWIPLMGTSSAVGEKLSTWHNGPDSLGPTSLQDDIAEIARSANIFGYRSDDHGNTIAGASPLAGGGTEWTGSGFIGAGGDVDWFSLDLAQPENLRIAVSGPIDVRNLDVAIELRDAGGGLIASANPDETFDASVVRNLSGRHYIGVKSNGAYGRMGQYTVAVTESLPNVSVSYPRAPLTTSESGRGEAVTLVLTSKPTADVTFNVASSDETEGVASTGAVVFTPDNWFIPQTVAVTGVADGVTDGAAGYSVLFAPAVSDDSSYSGFDLPDLSLVNLDASPGQIYWVRTDLTDDLALVERSTLAADGIHAVLDITAAFSPSPLGYYNPNRLTIDAVGGKAYWSDFSNKTINRANLDGTGAQVVLTLANAPNDVAVDPLGGKIYWTDAVLDKIQRANLDGSGVEDVIAAGLTAPSGLELDLVAGQLYWSDNATYEIRRAHLDGSGIELVRAGNGVDLPQNIALDVQGGKLYYGLRQNFDTQQIYRSNLDGSGEELLVDLDAIDASTANPVIQGIAIDHAGGRIIWSESLRQRVYSADLDGGNVAVVYEAGMNGLRGIAFLPATPGVTVTPAAGLETSEAGGDAAFTVVLNTPPTSEVTIPLATSDATEGVVAPASLTFTPANWSVPQTVTVTGRNDAFADGDKAFSVVFGPASSDDPMYAGLNANDVPIVNRDDELQTITVANTTSAAIPDRGTVTSTINLAAPGTIVDLDVRVNIAHGWDGDLDVTLIAPDGTRVELFTDVGGAGVNFTNTVLDDEAAQSITAGTAPFAGRYRPEGNLTLLEGKAAAGAWRLEVKDDARQIAGTLLDWAITVRTISGLPNPGAIVAPTTGLVTTEGGGTASFTVRLDAQPTADVTIPVGTSDASEGSPSTSQLTFTPANWNVPQTVVVSGVDDAIIDGAVTYTIVLGAAASTDPDFAGLNPADVAVSNADNDAPATKFYVVNDAAQNQTYEYGPTGGLVESYNLNSGNSAPRGAASSIAGDTTWVVDANRKVYVYNTSGGLLGSWTAGTLSSTATVEGIATNGADVWIVDARADRVYRYAGAASRLSGSASASSSFALNSGNTSPKDIVTDGVHLWVVNDNSTDRVFKYTLSGQLVGSWAIDSANKSPTGITLDPASPNHLWIVDAGTDRVYQYDNAVGLASGSLSAASSFALASGNANPQGIADPPVAGAPVAHALVARHAPPRRGDWPAAGSLASSPARPGRPSYEPTFAAEALSRTPYRPHLRETRPVDEATASPTLSHTRVTDAAFADWEAICGDARSFRAALTGDRNFG